MSKLLKKFLIGISVIMTVVLFLFFFLNSHVIGRYFLYQEKQDLKRVSDSLLVGAQAGKLAEAIVKAEESEDVVLAWVEGTNDNDLLNERLRAAFLQKGIGIDRYWLWDQDQYTAQEQGRSLRLYSQEKLHYSLLVEYLSLETDFIAAAKVVPATEDTITLINRVTGIVWIGAAVVILLLVSFFVRRIIDPLAQIGQAAQSIATLDFQQIEIHTDDELEELADSMNEMSRKLAAAHRDLEDKKRQMESLLSNVSHDLKTPVSLISAYAQGMKDGLDDGTFLDTMIRQNSRTQQLLERLLEYTKLQQVPLHVEKCRLDVQLEETLADYEMQAAACGLQFIQTIEQNALLMADPEAIHSLFDNLVSNAIKYADGSQIVVFLKKQENNWVFSVRNQVHFDSPISLDQLWEPFYTADKSRNKDQSGNGLGLAIVRAMAQRYGYTCHCKLDETSIEFILVMR